jgi:hypothetical protein
LRERGRTPSGRSLSRGRRKERALVTEVLVALGIALAAVLAWFGLRIVKDAGRALADIRGYLEEDRKPHVAVAVNVEELPLILLRIANDGRMPARELRLTISRGFFSFGDPEQNLAQSASFNQEIASFPPGSELFFPLAETSTIFGAAADGMATPSRFWVTVSYRHGDEIVEEATEIDLDAFRDAVARPNALATEMRKIRELLAAILEERSLRR